MALISLRQMLDHAAEHGYGVPAFNVNNLEQMRAIMEAADETDSPVIVQASAGARSYAGAPFLRHLILAAIEEFPHIPVCMHQDHGTSPAVCQRSIQLGFSSVMMDGSLGEDGKTPMDYDYNVRVTRQAVDSGQTPPPRLLYTEQELREMRKLQAVASVASRPGRITRRSAAAPMASTIPPFTRVFATAASTMARAAVCSSTPPPSRLSSAIVRVIASTSASPEAMLDRYMPVSPRYSLAAFAASRMTA